MLSEPPYVGETEKLVEVGVIASKGKSSLVQWLDGTTPKRAFVPVETVQNNHCPSSILASSVQYGVEWERFITPTIISQEHIANKLREAGFWTVQDIEQNVSGAQSAVAQAVGLNIATICRLARNVEREEKP